MNYMSPIEQELESILNTEVDLEPVVIDAEDDGLEAQLILLEQLADDAEDDDYPEDNFELVETFDLGEDYMEGPRRHKANRQLGLKNGRNILRVHKVVNHLKKKAYANSKKISAIGKRQRVETLGNRKRFRKIFLNQKRTNSALRVVGKRNGQLAGQLEQARLMAIPKLIASLMAPYADTPLGQALPGALAELASIMPPNKRMNKWAMIGISSGVVAASRYLGDWAEGQRNGATSATENAND